MNTCQSFYELGETERIKLTSEIISSRGTLLARWEALGTKEASSWSARAATATAWLSDQAGVLDLGCGTMSLERYLRPEQLYFPSDVVRRDDRTILCDLNQTSPPIVEVPAVACLGLLEYLRSPENLLKMLARLYVRAVITYCVIDSPQPLEPRRAHAWVNDFNQRDLEKTIAASGWAIVRNEALDSIQRIYLLSSRSFSRVI